LEERMNPRKLSLMHQMFGKNESHTCGECSNLISGRYRDRTYRKCKVYGQTNSEASDWAKRWTACGMFCTEYDGRPIIELVRRGGSRKLVDAPIDGQIGLEDAHG